MRAGLYAVKRAIHVAPFRLTNRLVRTTALFAMFLAPAGCQQLGTQPPLITAVERANEKRQIKHELTTAQFPSPKEVGL